MKVVKSLTIILLLFFVCLKMAANPDGFNIAFADTLFGDDFESGLASYWVVTDIDGEGKWEVVVEDGNSVLKVDALGGAWTGASVDSIASLEEYDELWAACRFKAQQDIGSCSELGLLTNPNELNGNWYLATCEGGQEIGIDECAIAWHNRVSYEWQLDQWYNMKIMVSSKDETLYVKMWAEGETEPEDWLTNEVLTSHLDEDGVGVMSYNTITYFDDVIVATSEESLVTASVDMTGKLSMTWGKIKLAD